MAPPLVAVVLIFLSVGANAFGAYDEVIDPISGRRGHAPRAADHGDKRRRQLKANCGAFTACPAAIDAAKVILGDNAGLVITNASFTKGVCSGTIMQWGIIPAGSWYPGHQMASWFPNGSLVLSSGDAAAANCGVNTLDYYTLAAGGGGDANLNSLIPAYTTYDAVALEFVVTPAKDGLLVFKYAFGSDEYTEWVGTAFNDVFGFFIAPAAQPITSGQNVAIVKGTASQQVSINNVNQNSHPELWNLNRIGYVSPLKNLEADGYTNLLNTQGYQVFANQPYRFKLAVADAGDHVLDSWVWLGGDTLFLDSKPVANGTVGNTTSATCTTNKIVKLYANGSYDPDTGDTLTYKWNLSAPCYPTVTLTGIAVSLDISTLADNTTYTVVLYVDDSSDVEDSIIKQLFVPPGCGSKTLAKTCGSGSGAPPPPPPPPSYKPSPPPKPPSAVKSPSPPPVKPSPPPPPPPSNQAQVLAGSSGVVPCGSPGVTLDASKVDDWAIGNITKAMDGDPFTLYYIWRVFDMADTGGDVPITSKTAIGTPIISFSATDLKQGRSLKKYRVRVDVTNTNAWDQGDGFILATETFIQVLQCPIKPAWPLPSLLFDWPESFTLACGATLQLNASTAVTAAVAKYALKNGIAAANSANKTLRWSIRDDLQGSKVLWTAEKPAPLTALDGSALVASGTIASSTFYSLRLVVLVGGSDFDSDGWETKFSVQGCAPGNYPSPPPPPPKV